MATRHQYHALTHTPELSLSDSEESYSSSEEEMPEREETDRLLRQAHHYVITEGGKDSPSTYMERIQRINRSLVQEISRHSYDCDPRLYRRVKQKIDHVLREFEDAADADSSVADYDELPEYYTAAAEDTLYRMDSSPVTPDGPSARGTMKRGSEGDVERTYLYGGPNNHSENWYNKAAASLPFPETIRMAEWESLRVHWDLATTGNMENTEPVTCVGVSFNHPLLDHHNRLAQYESGSRFKLPTPDSADMAKINEFGTVDQLHKVLDAFSQHDDVRENGDHKYAPRVFPETLDVGPQISLTNTVNQVRSEVNITPTKPRTSGSGNSRIGYTSPPTRTLLGKQRQTLVYDTENNASSYTIKTDCYDDLPITISSTVSNSFQTPIPIPEPTSRNYHSVSPAIRRIKAATEASIRSSILPQSPPAQPSTTGTQLKAHISVPTRRSHSFIRKNLLSAATEHTVLGYRTTAIGKRKRLSNNDTTEAETEMEAEAQKEPAKRQRKRTCGQKVASLCITTTGVGSGSLNTPTMTPTAAFAATPALSASGSSVASTPPVVKAKAAGKKQRVTRTKNDFEECVTPERYAEIMAGRRSVTALDHESIQRGRTRSGKLRAI